MSGKQMTLMASVVLLTVCCGTVSYRMDAVTHAPGRVGFTGYSVDYGDATPTPGTSLVQGEAVSFSVRVRYWLRSPKQAQLVLFFQDYSGNTVLRPGTTEAAGTAIDIQETAGRTEATLSYELAVPTNTINLTAVVGVYPEGATVTPGALLLKYSVVPSSDEK